MTNNLYEIPLQNLREAVESERNFARQCAWDAAYSAMLSRLSRDSYQEMLAVLREREDDAEPNS